MYHCIVSNGDQFGGIPAETIRKKYLRVWSQWELEADKTRDSEKVVTVFAAAAKESSDCAFVD